MHMLRKISCSVGLHGLYRSNSFERTCKHCGAVYVADYFDWRADGFATWRRVKQCFRESDE